MPKEAVPTYRETRTVSDGEYSEVLRFATFARSTARFVALLTIQRLSEMLSPALLFENPGPIRHRWLMAYVLTMAAL
jgi:hypothetical protein